MPGQEPSTVSTSLWQTPQACTLMRTCPAPGSGISRSTISKPAPGLEICATFICVAAIGTTLLVAINPPMKFQRLLRRACDCRRGARILLAVTLPPYLKDHFQLDRGAERKACDSIHQATRTLVLSEDVSQQLRSRVRDFRLFAALSRSGHRHAEANDAFDSVERSQMLPRDSEGVERREVSRLASSFHIEFRTDPPNEFRAVAFGGKHATQKKQIARLYRFHVGAEWLRGRGELDAQFFQPLLGAGRPGFSAHYKCSALRVCTHVHLLLQIAPGNATRTGTTELQRSGQLGSMPQRQTAQRSQTSRTRML